MKKRILILDDEQPILDILGQHLGDEGYECTATTSPKSALELIGQVHFDLLLTDIRMPEMSGLEVVRMAKSINNDLAIIGISAVPDVANAIEAMRAGAEDYILKPFNLTEITTAVESAIDKRSKVVKNRKYQQDLEIRVREATTDLERTNHELRSTKQYLENLLHSTVDAIITVNKERKIEFVNEGALEMLGYTKEEMVGVPCAQVLAGGPDEARHIERLLKERHPLQNYETEMQHRAQRPIPVNMSLSFVEGADGQTESALAICKDITEQKRLEFELKEMSIKDSLTGLYNQRHFYDRLQSEIDRAYRQGHPISLLLFDLDQFKSYNDCHGHLAGDKVLHEVALVVSECTREHVDLGFRYGGDEFTVILPEADEEQAHIIAERIRASFEAKRFDGLTLSIGLMTYRKGDSLRTFIKFTDAMMYDAKRSGGNRVYTYNPEDAPSAGSIIDEEEVEDA